MQASLGLDDLPGECVGFDALEALKPLRPQGKLEGMEPRRRLPFPELPERRRSRVHWPTVLALVGFGITLMIVFRAVRQPGVGAMPAKSPTEQPKKALK